MAIGKFLVVQSWSARIHLRWDGVDLRPNSPPGTIAREAVMNAATSNRKGRDDIIPAFLISKPEGKRYRTTLTCRRTVPLSTGTFTKYVPGGSEPIFIVISPPL